MVICVRYTDKNKDEWNSFLESSKTNLFLFDRDFVEYHKSRFFDHSLLFYQDGQLVAILPANESGSCYYSHGGLTFGGVVTGNKFRSHRIIELFDCFVDYLKSNGFKSLIYKSTPHFLCNRFSEEDKYALFRHGAKLLKSELTSVIELSKSNKMSKGRKALISKAKKNNVDIISSNDWVCFHRVLSQVLAFHGANPTHSVDELTYLSEMFPDKFKLYIAEKDEVCLAGLVLFDFGHTVHTQYLATTDEGKEVGALDFLISAIVEKSKIEGKQYFSFGISTTNNGLELNSGLLSQKESFGARSAVLETFGIEL